MSRKEEYNSGITRFIEELAATSLSETASDMRTRLEAYTKVRSVLSKLRSSGVRIFELPDFVDRYEFARGKKEYTPVELDFILRIENVELQIDVKSYPSKNIVLTRKDLQRYQQLLALNAKTQEILIVWVNRELPTLAVDLSKIQKYLLTMKGEGWPVPTEMLQPLPDAIKTAFNRHMSIWLKPADISVVKGPQYDVRELFGKALRSKIKNLKATSHMRRHLDKKQAIQSITDTDVQVLEHIFSEIQEKAIPTEDVEAKLITQKT